MSDNSKNEQRNDDRAGADDFRDPIEAMYRAHARNFEFCERLVQLAEDLGAGESAQVAASLLDYLNKDFPIHLADEEEDLFPLLKRRATSNERLASMLDLLIMEHQNDIEYGGALQEPLRAIAAGEQLADPTLFAHHVRAYRMLQHRHQAMENNFVLPMAEECLSTDDKAELGRRMAARHGQSSLG